MSLKLVVFYVDCVAFMVTDPYQQLALINQGGRFTKPNPNLPTEAAQKAWAKYDNDLFQTARLVTCGLYMNISMILLCMRRVSVLLMISKP